MHLTSFSGLRADKKVVLAAFGACFVLESASNALFGWRYAGGFAGMPVSLLTGAATLSVAFIGAYLAVERRRYSWRHVRRWTMTALLCACFAFSLAFGLRLVGISLADGALKRERQATQGAVASDTLEGKRAARKTLGTLRDPKQVQSEIDKLLGQYIGKARQTVGAATSGCSDPGWAPAVCKKVAELRVQLADAERAVQLDQEIAAAATAAGAAPVVAAGDPDLQALTAVVRLASPAWTVDDTRFWLPVCLVALMTTLATFGLSWTGLVDDEPAADPRPGPQPGPPPDDYWRGVPAYRPAGPLLPPPGGGGLGAAREDLRAAPAANFLALPAPAAGPHPGPTSSHASYAAPAYHGAPINIHVSGAQASPPGSGSPTPAAAAPPSVPPPASQAAPQATHLPPSPALARTRQDLPALPADVPPVDRAGIEDLLGAEARPALDVVASFRAACAVEAPGAMLALDDLYRRYRTYAGQRAVVASAFEVLAQSAGFAVVRIGEAAHVRDIALKPAVAAVA